MTVLATLVTVGLAPRMDVMGRAGYGSSQMHGRKDLLPQKQEKFTKASLKGMALNLERAKRAAAQKEQAIQSAKADERRWK